MYIGIQITSTLTGGVGGAYIFTPPPEAFDNRARQPQRERGFWAGLGAADRVARSVWAHCSSVVLTEVSGRE